MQRMHTLTSRVTTSGKTSLTRTCKGVTAPRIAPVRPSASAASFARGFATRNTTSVVDKIVFKRLSAKQNQRFNMTTTAAVATDASADLSSNPLLQDAEFPKFNEVIIDTVIFFVYYRGSSISTIDMSCYLLLCYAESFLPMAIHRPGRYR